MKQQSKYRRVSGSHLPPHPENDNSQLLHPTTDLAINSIYRNVNSGVVPALTPNQVIQLQRECGNQFVARILKPQAAARLVQRDMLEQRASEPERKKLEVLTIEGISEWSDDEIKAFFTDKTDARLPVETVTFGADVPAAIQKGLKHVATEIIGPEKLRPNALTHLPLNLKPFGGVDGIYRFTRIQRTSSPKSELIIEQVSSTPPVKLDKKGVENQESRFNKFEFQWGSGFGGADKKKPLLNALARIPDAVLERIRGVTFERQAGPTGPQSEPGHYDPNTHKIVFFDKADKKFLNSADSSGADWFTYIVTHEVSHAVDYESFTQARQKVATLAKDLAEAQAIANKADTDDYTPDGKPTGQKKDKDARVKQLQTNLNTARDELDKLKAGVNVAKGGAHTNNPDFDKVKGNPTSKYGGTKPVENFAEMLSLYILDPKLLKSLRPEAFDYFAKHIK